MNIHAIIKFIQNWGHDAVNDIEALAQPGYDYLKTNVPPIAIGLGETLLAGAAVGTPWGTLVAALISSAEAAGVKLLEDAAKVALNTAQNNLIAKGEPHA